MSPVISADVSDELAEQVDEHRAGGPEEPESRSQAIKRLIRAGLEAQNRPILDVHPLVAFSAVGWLLLGAAFGDASALAGAVGAVVALLPLVASLLPQHILERLSTS